MAERKATGLIAQDRRTHIATGRNGNRVALCETGVIVRSLPGFFRPGDPLNCRLCEDRAASGGGWLAHRIRAVLRGIEGEKGSNAAKTNPRSGSSADPERA